LPTTLEPMDASRIALDYATASRDLIHAEAVIAERRYRRHRLAADAYKLHLTKLRGKHAYAVRRVGLYEDLVASHSGRVGMSRHPCFLHGTCFPELPSDPGNVLYNY
jgi:hypothetical protein